MNCKNCGEEIVNDEQCAIDRREFCDLQCDLYNNNTGGYFQWVQWQEANNTGFVAKFHR